jgi:hypothetical protein
MHEEYRYQHTSTQAGKASKKHALQEADKQAFFESKEALAEPTKHSLNPQSTR